MIEPMNETNPLEPLNEILATPLDINNPNLLSHQLVQVEAWQALVSVKYREAERDLSKVKGIMFDDTLSSEDKRKNALVYAIREEQLQVDLLADLADIIRRRISLGQTLLKSVKAELDSGLR